jgi:chromosome partitioning protein
MILVFGGIKGGVGKTTLAVNMAIIRASQTKDILLVDADEQGSASDFTAVRNETYADKGGANYTCIKLHGATVRTEVLRLAGKYDDVVIDVGGRDTAGQRAALSIADMYVVPFLPGSFDVWTLDNVSTLIQEALSFNQNLQARCLVNRADSKGSDNAQAAAIAQEIPNLELIPVVIGNRKAFRSAASQGLAVTEIKPPDPKAVSEIKMLYESLFSMKKTL